MPTSRKNILPLIYLNMLVFAARFYKRTSTPGYPQKWILGHRGARAIAPENTITSFRVAMERGADGVEFDVIMSKDKIPVVIHDDTLERTTNGQGLVADHTAQELLKLDATTMMHGFSKEGVPTLARTLQSLPDGAIANIELKSAGRYAKSVLVDEVLNCALLHQERLIIIFSSFDAKVLRLLRARAPDSLIGLLLSPRDEHWPWSIKYWWTIKPDALHLPPELATTSLLKRAHKALLPVAIWTVNDPKMAQEYFKDGVTGIFTDRVPEVIGLVKKPSRAG